MPVYCLSPNYKELKMSTTPKTNITLPTKLPMLEELVNRRPLSQRAYNIMVSILLFIAGVSFYISYTHQVDFALKSGINSSVAGLFPLMVDTTLVALAFATVIFRGAGYTVKLLTLFIIGYGGLTLWFNIAHSPETDINSIIAFAVAPMSLIIVVEVITDFTRKKNAIEEGLSFVEGLTTQILHLQSDIVREETKLKEVTQLALSADEQRLEAQAKLAAIQSELIEVKNLLENEKNQLNQLTVERETLKEEVARLTTLTHSPERKPKPNPTHSQGKKRKYQILAYLQEGWTDEQILTHFNYKADTLANYKWELRKEGLLS